MNTLATVALVIAVFTTILSSVDAGLVGDACQTPNKTAGICTEIHKCPAVLELLKLRVKPLWAQNYLKNCSCGSFVDKKPVVCCPSSCTGGDTLEQHCNRHLINVDGCGFSTAGRILFGEQAIIGEFPWMAVLRYREKGKLVEKCGGTLITENYVLTAAHCISSKLKQVRLGEHDLRTNPDCVQNFNGKDCSYFHQDIDVKSFKKHPRYVLEKSRIINDIALIELKTPANVNADNVKTICLPLEERDLGGIHLTVAGWGVTENNTTSKVLMRTKLPMMKQDDCYRAFSNLGATVTITDDQLCAGGDTVNITDTCSGDSGGPLKGFPPGSENMVQYGIVSYGPRRCATPGVPAVYTNVAKYMRWILDTISP